MEILLFLMIFPIIIALMCLAIKNDKLRKIIVSVSTVTIAIASVITAFIYLKSETTIFHADCADFDTIIMVTEVVMALAIAYLGIKYKKYLASVLAIVQTGIMIWFELSYGHGIEVANNLYIDQLSIVMVLIIGIIGGLIVTYALGYMKDFQQHHSEEKDRRPWFFFLMFVFLSAMFGIVLSNNLIWMFFFWEITTLCSFFLIGFTKTEEAVNNSFRQLILNLIGGLAFVSAIVILGVNHDTLEFDQLLSLGLNGTDVTIVVACLTLAGIVKAAQMPFHSWLLGAMVAPTPTSALLHSSTMVKAGVFMILKLSPLLGYNLPGEMVMIIGGVTFALASMAAISQTNAKRVLAYSTIANLGLIVACGGVGTDAALWAGIMLLIFHAVTKSLLFLCVGTAEHHIGSRDIESMDELFSRMPMLSMLMLIGIAGMFIAPFGMLISKWAAMTAFIDSSNIILIICICFGSAVTAFYWAKWMGKLVTASTTSDDVEKTVHKSEWAVLGTLASLVLIVCFAYPLISGEFVIPYLETAFGPMAGNDIRLLNANNMFTLILMLAILLIITVPLFGKTKKRIVPNYMCGTNVGDNTAYNGSMGATVDVSLRNWYMEGWFGENRINKIGLSISILVIIGSIILIMMGVTI